MTKAAKVEAEDNNLRKRDRYLAVCIFFFFFSIYLLSASRVLHVDADEGIVFATIENIAKFGRFDIEQLASVSKSSEWEFGIDGKHYSKYGLMQSLLPVPLYLAAVRLPDIGNADLVLLFSPIVTALTAAFVFLASRTLGYSVTSSVVASLVFGLCTFVWAYSKRLLGEPASSLLLLTYLYWLLRFERDHRSLHLLLAGSFLGIAFAFKVSNAVLLPVGMAFIGYLIRDNTRRARCLFYLLAPFAIFVGFVGAYNHMRFGSPWSTGYGPHEGFTTPLLYGLWGLLLSPGRSFFLYSPILILSLIGLVIFFRKHRAAGILLVLSVAIQVLLYAKWWVWWGGWSWGPRFLVPLAPVMTLWLLPLIEKACLKKPFPMAAFALFLVLSLGIQIVGVAVDHSWYLRDQSIIDPDVHGITVSDWHYSPLLNQHRYIDPVHLDFIWAYNKNPSIPPEVDYISLGLMAGLVCFTVLIAFAVGRYYQQTTRGLVFVPLACSLLVATIAVVYITLVRANEHETNEYKALVSEINNISETGSDVVIFSDFLRNDDFLNFNKSSVFVLGWGEEPSPSSALQARLQDVEHRARQSKAQVATVLHITPNRPMDPNNGIEHFLNQNFFLSETKWFGNTRLVRYLAPKAGEQNATSKQVQLLKNVGGLFELRGARIIREEKPLKEGTSWHLFVTLEWRALAPTKQQYTIFVQLLTPDGKVLAQRDQMPVGNTLPTDKWLAGQSIDDKYAIEIKDKLLPGVYTLVAGMYNLADGKRLPVIDSSGQAITDFVLLDTIEVTP